MRDWRTRLLACVTDGPVVMVTVIATDGSTPREVGARMLVYADGIDGSIGGGQLEYQEIAAARVLLSGQLAPWTRAAHSIVLGPDAGQCCGGVVEVLHEVVTDREARVFATADGVERPVESGVAASATTRPVPAFSVTQRNDAIWISEPTSPSLTPLYLYGAGHVARALVHVLHELPFVVHWVDRDAARFPDTADDTRRIVVAAPADVARDAPAAAVHLVMTHSHDLDAEICEALLRRDDFAWLGLIGSATKRARFVQRFRRAGVSDVTLRRLICPIGLADVRGKAPAVIAISVAAQLLGTKS